MTLAGVSAPTISVLLLVLAGAAHAQEASMNASANSGARLDPAARITVREGRFVEKDSGRTFIPVGYNYIRLAPLPENKAAWHDNFNPEHYDRTQVETAFVDMGKTGYNIVRVFIDPRYPRGISGGPDSREFSPGYLDCLCDFLERAGRHGFRVIITNGGTPDMLRYSEIMKDRAARAAVFGAHNDLFLDPDGLKAKAQFLADMVAAVKARDVALLPVVLAWELDNESCYIATAPPFSLTEGKVTAANGKTYDMAVEADLQRLADEGAAHAAETCARAVRAVDPEAMFNVNVFTFAAVGRSGPGMLRRETSQDRRFPFDLRSLTGTSLEYLDVHFYPKDDEGYERDLKSIHFDDLRSAAQAAGKPLIVGEFGVFKHMYAEQAPAIAWMKKLAGRFRQDGFAGWLYWTYDCEHQEMIWHARLDGDAMFDMLTAEAARWK
jgi:hypothetical protein